MRRGSGIVGLIMISVTILMAIVFNNPEKIKSFFGFAGEDKENEMLEKKKEEMFQMCRSRISDLKGKLNSGETELFIIKADENKKIGIPLWENPDKDSKGAVLVNFNGSIEAFKTDQMNDFSFVITLDGYCGWLSPDFKLEKLNLEKTEEIKKPETTKQQKNKKNKSK
jgi:hypothetical protein